MAADERPRRPLATVRARTTAAATVIVGIALAVATIGLVVLLRDSLVENVDDVAELRAQDIAAQARQGTLPRSLAVAEEEGAVAQVVDSNGVVVAASTNLRGEEPIARIRPSGREPVARTVEHLPVRRRGGFRVLAIQASTPDGIVTVYVGSSLEPVDDTIATLGNALAVGAPLLLVLVALTAWLVVGWALRPVDAITAEVADISGRSLERRVPVPPTRDEIGRLATTMNTMLDRLEAAAERQRRFVADASHELRTPLATARTDLEVVLAHPDSADWHEVATELLAANRRMERLVGDLLYLARADDQAPTPPRHPVDLDDVVLAEAARLRDAGRVRVDTSRVSAAAVEGRRDDLARMVGNLLDNAERFAVSVVTIEVGTDNGTVTLVVEDDGPGIPPADRERVFERFTRLDEARDRDSGGAGLGLAIAGEIADAHGGTIVVDSTNTGARLVVRLPSP